MTENFSWRKLQKCTKTEILKAHEPVSNTSFVFLLNLWKLCSAQQFFKVVIEWSKATNTNCMILMSNSISYGARANLLQDAVRSLKEGEFLIAKLWSWWSKIIIGFYHRDLPWAMSLLKMREGVSKNGILRQVLRLTLGWQEKAG